MANINLSWNDPASKTDIDYICVHRITGDQSATYNGAVSAADAATFAATAGAVLNSSDATYTYDTAGGAKTFTDSTAANSTTYTYGVFSKNGAGYGPGEAVTISV